MYTGKHGCRKDGDLPAEHADVRRMFGKSNVLPFLFCVILRVLRATLGTVFTRVHPWLN